MDKLILIVWYFIEGIKYILANKLVFRMGRNVKKQYILGAIIVTAYVLLFSGNYLLDFILIYVVAIVVGYESIIEYPGKKILNLIYLVIMLVCIDKSTFVYWNLFQTHFSELPYVVYYALVLNSIWGLLFTAVLYGIVRKWRKHREHILNKNATPTLISITGVIFLATIVGISELSYYVSNDVIRIGINVLISVSYVGLCLLFWLLMYFRSQKEEKEKKLNAEEQIREYQTEYYKNLLKREEDTRRFRHDIKTHLCCLNELTSQGKYDELETYLKSLNAEFNEIKKHDFHTSNDMFDIILYDKLFNLHKKADIQVDGYFSKNIKLELIDFCSVFANLLENAVEELNNIGGREIKLCITIRTGVEYTEVCIRNTSYDKCKFNQEGIPETKKHNKKFHGFGLLNVKKILGKYNGELYLAHNDNMFEARVIF